MAEGQGAGGEGWLQRLIASALSIGISKRELFEDYYLDEVGEVMAEWNALHNRSRDEETEKADPLAFLGAGGEWV